MEVKSYYTDLFPETIVSILLVFLVFLTVIVLIMIRHSIATSVEIDYVNLGVLKAMGFTKGNIRIIFVLQYLTAQVIGAAAGFYVTEIAEELNRRFGAVLECTADEDGTIIRALITE